MIRRLQQYQNEGRLSSTTLFCTFDITDLYTMLPQEESLDVLIEFLLQHGYQKVKGIPIDAIRTLANIVIKENVFAYEKKFYRQIVGGAMGSAFTLTLANIFMWKWEQRLVQRLLPSNEIYGRSGLSGIHRKNISKLFSSLFGFLFRYIDDIFLTWNGSIDSLHQMLNEANCHHTNIKLVRQIGQTVPFLDVLVQNQHGIVLTKVYHKSAAEPYIAPFPSDHPRHMFANIVETALLRALRYSSTLSTFIAERRYIILMLLYNEYAFEMKLSVYFSTAIHLGILHDTYIIN